jgi:hypothetical protein
MHRVEQEQQDFKQLSTVCVTDERAWRFDVQELEAQFPSLTDVDASRNLIAGLPPLPQSLVSVNLSCNPLWLQQTPMTHHLGSMLATLCVSNTGLAWPLLAPYLAVHPLLTTLDISSNPLLASVPAALVQWVPRLERLHMCECAVAQWAQLDAVSLLPALTHLFVSENAFASISVEPGSFAALRVLSVSKTMVDQGALGALAALSALRHVRFTDTPAHRVPRSRLLLIAALPQLTHLNGADISARERSDADIYRQRLEVMHCVQCVCVCVCVCACTRSSPSAV